VVVTNAFLEQVDRRIDSLQILVPKSKADVASFAPLNGLDLVETQILPNLVHPYDEKDTIQRVNGAKELQVGTFGAATLRGMGLCPVEELIAIFEIKASVSAPCP
jgi:hypothetical protein